MSNNASIISYDEIEVGNTFSFIRTITCDDVLKFASLSGDYNPLHVNERFGLDSKFGKNVVHGMLTSSLFSTLIGMHCPGEKSLYLAQTIKFKMPLYFDETVRVVGTVISKIESFHMIKLKTEIFRNNDLIVTGEAQVQVMD